MWKSCPSRQCPWQKGKLTGPTGKVPVMAVFFPASKTKIDWCHFVNRVLLSSDRFQGQLYSGVLRVCWLTIVTLTWFCHGEQSNLVSISSNTSGDMFEIGTKRIRLKVIANLLTQHIEDGLGSSGLSTWKYQFLYDHWGQATLSLVSTWMGDYSNDAWVLLLTLKVG